MSYNNVSVLSQNLNAYAYLSRCCYTAQWNSHAVALLASWKQKWVERWIKIWVEHAELLVVARLPSAKVGAIE